MRPAVSDVWAWLFEQGSSNECSESKNVACPRAFSSSSVSGARRASFTSADDVSRAGARARAKTFALRSQQLRNCDR